MIWGKTTKSFEKTETEARNIEQFATALDNKHLCEWHKHFTWRMVTLLDGRKAMFSYVDRKFQLCVPGNVLKRLLAGGISVQRTHGKFLYKEIGAEDSTYTLQLSPTKGEEEKEREAPEEPEGPKNGRREAIQNQKSRRAKDLL